MLVFATWPLSQSVSQSLQSQHDPRAHPPLGTDAHCAHTNLNLGQDTTREPAGPETPRAEAQNHTQNSNTRTHTRQTDLTHAHAHTHTHTAHTWRSGHDVNQQTTPPAWGAPHARTLHIYTHESSHGDCLHVVVSWWFLPHQAPTYGLVCSFAGSAFLSRGGRRVPHRRAT